MTQTVLVTGATGTTGAAVVAELAAADADVRVRAGVHSPESAGDPGPDVEVVGIELSERDTLDAAFAGVDRAYLLTPFLPDQTPLVENLVDAAAAAGVDHLVRHSALGAGADDPPHSLAANHRAAERLVEASGAAHTHVRPTAFMQNLLGDLESIREGALYEPVGEPVAHVDARDVARVAATVLIEGDAHAGEAYPVTGPAALTYGEVADVLSDVLGREVSHVQVSMEEAREAMVDAGMPDALVEGFLELQRWFDAGGGATVYDTVETVTGTPARPLRRFVEDHAGAFEPDPESESESESESGSDSEFGSGSG